MAEEENTYVLQTTGFDARFPNQNQTKHCWQNFVDYHKCVNAKGEEFAPCQQFKKAYRSLCPSKFTIQFTRGERSVEREETQETRKAGRGS
ncbi:cytochrome c oxidase subunit 6B [Cryptococcus amylolentus CBS 6039]|uniref:Cytochrome c oxidase subunit 12, mitochondrial n=1 Tax=Cryptococcus amylolentus CBS 6039 TaxID=1295533 RepID=A0A1E3HL33_9TREE|nr:cytochrome c oxidase subunit 6B [Cryptococcus amylolentus CBS 6039]ODN76835.1 cytochrome c oxidase subunit 6B [Cryptococcus amylolentus CBS 6039]